MPAAPLIDDQLDLVLAVELTERGPLIRDELLHPIGLVEHLIPLVVGEYESVSRGAAVIMRRPALDRRSGKVGPLFEEAPRPIQVVPVRSRRDQIQRDVILREPLSEFPVFAAII